MGLQRILLGVFRHSPPIDATNVFAPAEHLANETFGRRQRGLACMVRSFCCRNHLPRIEQLQIHGCRQPGVEQKGLATPHRVLESPESRKTMVDKVFERLSRLSLGHWPIKMLESSRMVRKSLFDQTYHFPSNRIGGERAWRGDRTRTMTSERITILRIEVPFSSEGFPGAHQNRVFSAHVAVEVLESQLLAPGSVVYELLPTAKEMAIWSDF
ncbi:MAG: hypothetical protein KatS3mg111_2556 [Pirellulaceae bacterium]|nr:MAG: hypothetical protein KatS3mg111_2556 [Pirellulaceae bacterium]